MELGDLIIIAVMVVAFIGMIVCAKKQKTNPNAKTFAILCLIVVVICAGWYIKNTSGLFGMTSEMKGVLASYERFSEATAKKAAEYVSQNKDFAGKKVVIVATGGNEWAKQDNKLANYVKQHLTGVNAEIKGLPYDPPKDQGGGMPEEYMNAKLFNKLFDENKDAAAFIMTISLPYDPSQLSRINLWNKKNPAKLVLINSDLHMLGAEVAKGTIAAAVVMRPDLKKADFEKLAPRNLDEAFKDRYILITPQNIKEIAQKYSELFKTR